MQKTPTNKVATSKIHQIYFHKCPKSVQKYNILYFIQPISKLMIKSSQKYNLSYFRFVVSEIFFIFVEKFIMSDYGTDGYNETA